MSLRKTKIDWTDYAWNPITGCTLKCKYCYAQRFAERYGWSTEPRFHPLRLKEARNKGQPGRVFISTMGEPFDPWWQRDALVDEIWRQILEIVRQTPQRVYYVLSKRPAVAADVLSWLVAPENLRLGFSGETPKIAVHRIREWLWRARRAVPLFVSLEPLFPFRYGPAIARQFREVGVRWVIIGKLTQMDYPKGEYFPVAEARKLVEGCQEVGIPVWIKDNAQGDLGSLAVQQRPEGW